VRIDGILWVGFKPLNDREEIVNLGLDWRGMRLFETAIRLTSS